MAFDPFSPEAVYALKTNIAYPVIGASAAAVATLAQNRIQDAEPGVTTTIAASNMTVVKQ